MAPNLVLGIPPSVIQLVQDGLLERAFHDGLFPALQYRAEADDEEWDAHTGTSIFMSRPGTLAPVTRPLKPGADPVPQAVAYEQWEAKLDRYSGTIDTHIPTSVVSNSDQFLRNIHQLGLQAGQSLNRIPRNSLFKAYLSGQTVTIAAALTTDTQLRIASCNGFVDVINKGQNVRPSPVSTSTPLAATVVGVAAPVSIIGCLPDDPDDPYGPGTLLLAAQLGVGVAARTPVTSSAAPLIIRSGGGSSVDGISANDTFTLQDVINAVNKLRRKNVPPHEDGYYHVHINTDGNTQVFQDPAFQRLNTALPDGVYYQEAFLGTIAGCMFFMNTESPDWTNSGTRVSTGANAFYSSDVGAETTNNSGVNIGRIVVTGRGALYERWLDEKKHYVTEAGLTGKQGDFQIVNAGIEVETEHVRLILRAPLNRLQDVVAASWAITTCFPVPTDSTSGDASRYKRAVVIEHAQDS